MRISKQHLSCLPAAPCQQARGGHFVQHAGAAATTSQWAAYLSM